jgi:hypothetical protein
MKAYGRMKESLNSFSTLVLHKVNGQFHAPAVLFPAASAAGIHKRGRWVGPRASLDALEEREISCLCQIWNHDAFIIQPIA